MDKTIIYAKRYIDICNDVVTAIKLVRKLLLFNKETAWAKKGEKTFDATMKSYDGAEICELVGLYLLDKLLKILDQADGGLSRDDGLAAVNNSNGLLMDKLRKKVIALFKEENLSITIDTDLDETDFLDVTFNFKTGKYFPFRKPNINPLYTNYKSNHTPPIIKELPKMINKRIYDLSCNKEEFNKAKPSLRKCIKGKWMHNIP